MQQAIRTILRRHGRLAVDVDTLGDDSDLHQAGLTSYASVGMMLALEKQFGVEFPDRMLRRSTFRSLRAIEDAVLELQRLQAPQRRAGHVA